MSAPPVGHYLHLRGVGEIGFDVSHDLVCKLSPPRSDETPPLEEDVALLFLGDRSTQSVQQRWDANLTATSSFVTVGNPFRGDLTAGLLAGWARRTELAVAGNNDTAAYFRSRTRRRGRPVVVLGNAVADLRSAHHDDYFLRHARQLDAAVQKMG